jgi:muramoyltetrapeptide carboxypeptidase
MTTKIGIAIIAPGGRAPAEAALALGVARLEQRGCLVHNYYDPARDFQRFGGTDDARLAQLEAAVADPEVQVVMALRGQYGITRLLPRIDFEAIAASGKIFVGFSDMTALHMGLMAKTGAISYAGPMFAGDSPPTAGRLHARHLGAAAGPTHVIANAAGNPTVDLPARSGAATWRCWCRCWAPATFPASKAASCMSKTSTSIRTGSSGCCCS